MENTAAQISATAAVDETLARWAAQDAAYNAVVEEFRPERAPRALYGKGYVLDREFEARYVEKLAELGIAA